MTQWSSEYMQAWQAGWDDAAAALRRHGYAEAADKLDAVSPSRPVMQVAALPEHDHATDGRDEIDAMAEESRPQVEEKPTDTVPRAEVEAALRHMATVATRSKEWLSAADAVHAAARAAVKAAGYCRDEWPGAHTMVDLAEALRSLDKATRVDSDKGQQRGER